MLICICCLYFKAFIHHQSACVQKHEAFLLLPIINIDILMNKIYATWIMMF